MKTIYVSRALGRKRQDLKNKEMVIYIYQQYGKHIYDADVQNKMIKKA